MRRAGWLLATLTLGACASPAATNEGQGVPTTVPMSVASLEERVGPLFLDPDMEPAASFLLEGDPDARLFAGDRAVLSYDLPSGQVMVTQGNSREDWTSTTLPFGEPARSEDHPVQGFSLLAYQDSQGGDPVGPTTVYILDPTWLVQINPLPDEVEPGLQPLTELANKLTRAE